MLAFSPLALFAAPATQFGSLTSSDAGPTADVLLLGEYSFVNMLSGDTYTAEIVIPESSEYLITAVDDEAAQDFDLVVTDSAGNELYNDVFATTGVVMETGTVSLTFTAAADNELGFVVLGQIGGMTSDENQPGKLVPGTVYINDEVSDTLYATVSIPPSAYPREVLLAFQPREGDSFYAYLEGENVYNYMDTDSSTTDIMRFWTHGGDYNLEVDAYERRSELALVVFVTGEPSSITMNEPFENEVTAGAKERVFELELDANYTDIELTIEADETLGITVLDNYYDYDAYYSSYMEDELDIDALYPGVYYVVISAEDYTEETIPFTLQITGDAGRPTVALEDGVAFEDEFDNEESINYSFEVANPGAMVTIDMTGDDDDVDFDLRAGLQPGGSTWSSYSSGSDETLTFLAPIAGTYYVSVISNDNDGSFAITANEGDAAPVLETTGVFYDNVEGRSQNLYLLPVSEAGQLISVILVGPEDTDLDLTVKGYNSSGDSILNLSGYSSGSAEAVSYLLPEAGLYEVGVSSTYSEEGGNYFIQAQIIDPRFFGSQWASSAVASSEYGAEDFSAAQATGASDTPTAGDYPTAWASQESDGGVETLELTFEIPVRPSGIAIFESFNPGAITTIEAYDSDNDEWVIIYEGEATPTEETYRVFIPEITSPEFVTDQIRLTLDTAAVPGFNEIDAVQLFGRP
jgi:hypothetical protein